MLILTLKSYVWSPHKFSMTKKEIEMAMDALLLGAARVRAHKYETKFSKNVHRDLTSRIAYQMIKAEKKNLKAA